MGFCLSKEKYAAKLTLKSGLAGSKPYTVPMGHNLKAKNTEYDTTAE